MSPRRLAFAAVVLVVSSTVACTGPSTSRRPVVVQGLTNERQLFTATVNEEIDWLTGVDVVPASATGIPLTNPVNLTEGIANVDATHRALFLAWVGLECEDRPSLIVSGRDDHLVIRLDRGPQREGQPCPAYPHYFALRLEFSRVVDAGSTRLEVA